MLTILMCFTQLGGDSGGSSLKEIDELKAEVEKWRKEADVAVDEQKKCETELRQYISNLQEQLLQSNAKVGTPFFKLLKIEAS